MTDEKKKPEEDEVSEEELDDVAGGVDASKQNIMESLTGGGLPDGIYPETSSTPTPPPAGPAGIPNPYPNSGSDGTPDIMPVDGKS